MRQCPVCKSETGDDPVCPVCGFDITCDYERFPTLGVDIPRDLKARALQRVKSAKGGSKKAEKLTGAPKKKGKPPVSLLSQKEIEDRINNRGVFASVLAIWSFFASFFVYVKLVYNQMSLSSLLSDLWSNPEYDGALPTMFFLCLLTFCLLKWSLKKMKPDEWVWKRQSGGKWIVLEKEAPGSGQEKKMLTALLLFYFGWMFGLDIMYLDGFSKGKWKLIIRCLISFGGIDLIWRITQFKTSEEAWAIIAVVVIVLVLLIFAYIMPIVRILRLPPEFEKGEY